MVSIQIDEQTARAIESGAKQAGLTVAEYVRTIVPVTRRPHRPSWDELEREISDLSTDGPSLPSDFSRADIYADHD